MTPLILAVDTTGEYGSLALARGEETVEEMAISAPTGYGQVLYGCIRELLERNRVTLGDISCFAAASGPGTFTGVRVGLACVKGLGRSHGQTCRRRIEPGSLGALRQRPLRAAVLDARRGDIYAAVYDEAGRRVVPETVVKAAAWAVSLPPGVEFVAMDWTGLDSLPDPACNRPPRAGRDGRPHRNDPRVAGCRAWMRIT